MGSCFVDFFFLLKPKSFPKPFLCFVFFSSPPTLKMKQNYNSGIQGGSLEDFFNSVPLTLEQFSCTYFWLFALDEGDLCITSLCEQDDVSENVPALTLNLFSLLPKFFHLMHAWIIQTTLYNMHVLSITRGSGKQNETKKN